MDILSQIIKWASTTQYMTKSGTDESKAYIRGYEQGIADAKAKMLTIANSENQ